MGGNVVPLDRYRPVQFRIPLDSHPRDKFLPVYILDDSLQDVDIIQNDLVAANISIMKWGWLTIVETRNDLLFGFPFPERDNRLRLELVCTCPDCSPYYLSPAEILRIGAITRVYRRVDDVSFDFSYRKEREALWTPLSDGLSKMRK